MQIAGFQPFTLSDYPGHVAAIVFTQGCNLRCPFCHNGELLPMKRAASQLTPPEQVFAYLQGMRGKLDGVVVTGGEPTLQPGLPGFIMRLKAMGFKVKLDTNGTRPQVLEALLGEGLLDFVAMDIKAPWDAYERLCGVRVPTEPLRRSVELIAASGLPHQFRTTAVPGLLSQADLDQIQAQLPPASPWRQQRFRPEKVYDPQALEL